MILSCVTITIIWFAIDDLIYFCWDEMIAIYLGKDNVLVEYGRWLVSKMPSSLSEGLSCDPQTLHKSHM